MRVDVAAATCPQCKSTFREVTVNVWPFTCPFCGAVIQLAPTPRHNGEIDTTPETVRRSRAKQKEAK